MSLKIIGGEFGGRPLKSVRGMGTRPLLGQVREAIFNILGQRMTGALVWDLFAGSGASGIEALSRGAARVLFCEKNGRAIGVLQGNLEAMGEDAVLRSVVMRTDAWDPPVMHRGVFGVSAVESDSDEDPEEDAEERDAGEDDFGAVLFPPGDDGEPEDPDPQASDAEIAPDIVFLDPPYAMVAEDPVKSMARARRLLERTASRGCVVFHFEVGVLDEDDFDGDLDVDLREWGTTAIAFLWRAGQAPDRVRKRRDKEVADS